MPSPVDQQQSRALDVAEAGKRYRGDDADTSERVLALIRQVGDSVRDCRKSRRMSRRELSERSGVSPRYLVKLESGDGNISIGLLKKIALALEVPIEQFLMDTEPRCRESRRVMDLYRDANAATRERVRQILESGPMHARQSRRLCLIGLRGAGKSTLGARIAKSFDAPFVELNNEIERHTDMPISEIIALYGQEGFRQIEAKTLSEIIERHERAVVAVAGGIVSNEDTFFNLLSRFHTVWIKTTANEHMDRVRAQGDLRPMQGNPQAMSQLQQILRSREVFYSQAEHVLDTSGKSVEKSLAELSDLISKHHILGNDQTQ